MKTSIATSLVVLLAATGAVGQPRPPTARPTAVDGTTDTLPDAGPPTPEPTATDGQPAAQQNLFAGFNTELLENGLRVWYQHIPGAANTSVGLSVPYGWDMDPLGKEETAHFLEHMLFGDHRGLTELEIKEQVDSLGGSRNGFTSPDRTFYYVTLPAEFGLLGVEWLARIVEPHDMVPAVVERNRQPVALEIRARPRELFDHLAALVVPWFTLPGFWEREFGIETRQRRRYDRFESLHAITPQDLRDFYDRYYAPEAMTLVIAGDLPNDAALPLVRETFGRLPTRSAPTAYGRVVDPGRPYQRVTWQFRPNVRYRRYFKIYDQTRDTRIRLLFLGRYLQRRLNARLRFGDTKAVYGIRANAVARGPALSFQIEAPINQEHWAFAVRSSTKNSRP